MRKQFIKNIKGLVQAGEELPAVLRGKQMNQLALIENAYLALEDNEVIAYGPMNEWHYRLARCRSHRRHQLLRAACFY